jgi:hypothetical protein
MPSTTQKINEIYRAYHAAEDVTVSRGTLLKYIKLKELLDPEVFLHLDKTGSDKLTMGFALKLCSLVINPMHQRMLLPEILAMPRTYALASGIQEATQCLICTESHSHFEAMPCCHNLICASCIFTGMETLLLDLSFQGLRCPFCRTHLPVLYVEWFLNARYRSNHRETESWRTTRNYRQMLDDRQIYSQNLHHKYESMVRSLEDTLKVQIQQQRAHGGTDDFTCLDQDHVYGTCSGCTLGVSEIAHQPRVFEGVKMIGVEKQCANGENEVLVLQPEMFLCTICKSYQEDEDVVFKQCPHCGIKTMRPEGCNYVRCGDHRWCFICNERLPLNHEGHNVHFYTGPGTSPYSMQCRESTHSDKPTFILDTCACSACAPHEGKSLCTTMDCLNRVAVRNTLCETCR